MSFGGGPSPEEQAKQQEAARAAEAARLAKEQQIKDAETLKKTLASKASQATSEAAASAQRQTFLAAKAGDVANKASLGSSDEMTKKKTLLANYGK